MLALLLLLLLFRSLEPMYT